MQKNSARRCYQIEIRSNKMNRAMIYNNLRTIKEDKKSRKNKTLVPDWKGWREDFQALNKQTDTHLLA